MTLGALAVAISAITACNSSSDSRNDLSFQAIDGYLYGASVYCDGNSNGSTGKAGSFTCPESTQRIRIRGGSDVGFDAERTQSSKLFLGELQAPGDLTQVTPLSTLALSISDESENLTFAQAVQITADAFGLSSLDLDADAASKMQLVRLNAQTNTIIESFSATTDEYPLVVKSLGDVVKESAQYSRTLSMTNGVSELMQALNEKLKLQQPELALDDDELAEVTALVQNSNAAYEAALTPGSVAELAAAYGEMLESALGFNRDDTLIVTSGYYSSTQYHSLDEFESNAKYSGRYNTVLDTYGAYVWFDYRNMEVTQSLENTAIGLGFSFEATSSGDKRRLSVTTDDALLSALEGSPASLTISFPQNAVFNYTSTDQYGVMTEARISIDDARVFDAENGIYGISLQSLENALEKKGIEGFFSQEGNYKLTTAISDIGVRSFDSDGNYVASSVYSIEAADTTVTGNGFQGYVTVVDYGW